MPDAAGDDVVAARIPAAAIPHVLPALLRDHVGKQSFDGGGLREKPADPIVGRRCWLVSRLGEGIPCL